MTSEVPAEFRPRGPLFTWWPVVAGSFLAFTIFQFGFGAWSFAAIPLTIVGVRLIALNRVIEFQEECLTLGNRVIRYDEIQRLSTRQQFSAQRNIHLVVELKDRSHINWYWISYKRTAAGNLLGKSLLPLRTQSFLSGLSKACDLKGLTANFTAFDQSPN